MLLLSKVISYMSLKKVLQSLNMHILGAGKEKKGKCEKFWQNVKFGNFGTLSYGMFLVAFLGYYSYCRNSIS